MYQAIIVLKYGIFKKERSGSVNTYNTLDSYIATIEGVSEDECRKKVEKFISENEFKQVKPLGAKK